MRGATSRDAFETNVRITNIDGLARNCRQRPLKDGRVPEVITVQGRDGKRYPGAIGRQPRGQTEGASSDKGGGGGGGGFSKGKGDSGPLGGTTSELEAEARQTIRNGEIGPFELAKISSATPLDYAVATIELLETMRRDHPQRRKGLVKLRDWIERELRGENATSAESVLGG